MVAIPNPVSPTIAAIDKAYADGQETDHYPYIRGSEIGDCERKIWYSFRWVVRPEKFEGRILRLFQTGHRAEAEMIRDLQKAGVRVTYGDGSGGQIAVQALDGHFRGHLDGECEGIKEAPKTPHLLECKTHNAKSFASLLKHGVAVSKPMHLAQMQAYMGLRGLERAFYLAKNKDTDELYAERIHFDKKHFDALMAKAQRVKENHKPPPRISEDPEFFTCRFCSKLPVCHQKVASLRNCRTCLHSSPIENGNWFCHFHKKALLKREQLAGCPKHLYLPGLIHGEQIDADAEANTVTYKMEDGKEWIDGKMQIDAQSI